MTPIHELLKRIRWDPDFGRGSFVVGYEDHQRGVLRVPLERLRVEVGGHFMFGVQNDDGTWISLPFHRVREVWRDGVLIWQRTGERPGG